MAESIRIRRIHAREILDSRGFPTVEVDCDVDDPAGQTPFIRGRAAVPSGASTGEGEALELRDGDSKRFLGKGVAQAVENVTEKIAPALTGREFARQPFLDDALLELDGTDNKSSLGANAILGVSMAFARATSLALRQPCHQLIAGMVKAKGVTLPVPLMNVMNGGKHANNSLAIQEFMIAPIGFGSFSDALRAGTETFHYLKKILVSQGHSIAVGDEGGFAPNLGEKEPHVQTLSLLLQAIKDAGYKPGKEICLALDCASSEFASREAREGSNKWIYQFEGKKRSASDMTQIYQEWVESYPIISIEDGLAEHDWDGWQLLTQRLGKKCQLVGDDLFVTNAKVLKKGIETKTANSILIKLNQIGTVTETLETINLAHQAGYTAIASHRSGETEDVFIAELAVGTDCGQIKTGSASRTDRIAKYNQLLRIEEELGNRAQFAGRDAFGSLSH